ncbi:unnamed protein product [Moneuplotes crassus]|uniref:Uncharacterized protein n=1 Tax=Euplotes crassus TaxID=5936 RepID=A0AAD2DBT5_EUPCR|nr:unnamed protein product [Moneuplotes crassus]
MGCCLNTTSGKITDRPYYSLAVSVSCWSKETHGLYDYDSNSSGMQQLRITNTCAIVNQEETQVHNVPPRDAVMKGLKTLFITAFKNGKYWMFHPQDFNEEEKVQNPIDQVWISLRGATPAIFPGKFNKSLGYKLTDGDIIKFGRVRFRVKRIINCKRNKSSMGRMVKYDPQFDVSMNEMLVNKFTSRVSPQADQLSRSKSIESNSIAYGCIEEDTIQEKIAKIQQAKGQEDFDKIRKEAQCRICLGEEEDSDIEENPLISPCKCTGTLQYIHLDCLKKWLDSKIYSKLSEYTYSYNWKNLVCELCGVKFQDSYIINGKEIYVLNYLRPEHGCGMILESYTNTPHKTIHVLVSNKRNNPFNADIEYCVGRSNESAIRITDISVSRTHSSITFSNGSYYVRDEAAKFGTLLYLREPIPIPKKKNFALSVQFGRFMARLTPQNEEPKRNSKTNPGKESTYNEDSPYLPRTLLEFLEEQSVNLGLQNNPAKFDDLQKIKDKELMISQKENDDTSSISNLQQETSMKINNAHGTNMDTAHQLGMNQMITQVQRRNSDLHGSLDEVSHHIQEINLDNVSRSIHAPRRMNTSGINLLRRNEDEDRATSERLNPHSEMGTAMNNQITSPSPLTSNPGIQESARSSLRDRLGQGSDGPESGDLQTKKDITPARRNPSIRHTRARMMNLTLGNEEAKSDLSGRIEERKSEFDEESIGDNQWAIPDNNISRIQVFESFESYRRGSEGSDSLRHRDGRPEN